MQHVWLPTIDHCEPSIQDIIKGVEFIEDQSRRQQRVYVHCKAGHGRSAAVAYAWMVYKFGRSRVGGRISDSDLRRLNEDLCRRRHVRKKLWAQHNIHQFIKMLQISRWTRIGNVRKSMQENACRTAEDGLSVDPCNNMLNVK
eukprot:gnl/MRDRNA2_/MRDRNA2_75553_c0_seq1.p1 gnl/MRDRNA2_/MRDRNA2_75553_c0~~gnl/MRDRNA2_/MRDRNA2_75553_c0_seq1.p1  ORF type:complete len:143 (+),score=18.40 gnl/MRDRNA2_/MRDRNA2_75553_c0_seq1:270-698(+)